MASRARLGMGLLLFGLSAAAPVSAAPTGGPAALLKPQGAALSFGVAYVERDVKGGGGDEVSSVKTLLRGDYGILEDLTAYGFIGFSDLKFDDADFEGARAADLGAGVRYGLASVPSSAVRLVLDLQAEFLRASDESNHVRQEAGHIATYVVKEFAAAGDVGYFYPFGGFRVSYAKYLGSGDMDNHRSKTLVGVFAGSDYFVNPNVFFSAEVHLFDEMSIAASAGYRF